MIEKQTIWQDALGELAEDLFDLFLSPLQPFPENVSYPATPGMEALINDRFDSLYLPEKRLAHVVELAEENWTELDERKLVDCIVLFEWEMLKGFGDDVAFTVHGASLEGLRRLAEIWGRHLAHVMGCMLRMADMYDTYGELLLAIFRQLPARELGEAIRESFTPGYLKAHASVKYVAALFFQDRRMLREAERVLQASDADLACEIELARSGMSSRELGIYVKHEWMEIATSFGELFASQDFRQKLPDTLPFAFQGLAWYMGYCFRRHFENNPARARRVLEAIGSHKEAHAVMEEYKWLHSWGGDRNKAVDLGWQSVARKFFGLSGQIPTVSGNEEQEWGEDQQLKLMGLAGGLETYCRKNPAFVGLMDGVSGGVRSYLAKAAENKELSYYREQYTDGNRALTEAEHVADHRTPDEEELTDDEILSRLKERRYPSGDPVVQEMEANESSIAWYGSLTEREKTAVNLAAELDTEEEIAAEMGISQQRVSQLLAQAWRKRRKICD